MGLTTVMDTLVGPISGVTVNPAHMLGAMVVDADWANQWIDWVGPILGGGLGVFSANFTEDMWPRPSPVGAAD